MNRLIRSLSIFAILPLLIVSCNLQAAPAQSEQQVTSAGISYERLIGKSATDQAVTEFIVDNHCSSSAQFQVCKESGMALLINLDQIVETVYLYLNNAGGFVPYKGELPLGLKFYDTMGAVEYKLNRLGIGRDGLPDEAAVPDHFHYQAVYNEAGVTILYNSPFADEDATIYAVMVNG